MCLCSRDVWNNCCLGVSCAQIGARVRIRLSIDWWVEEESVEVGLGPPDTPGDGASA